MSNFKAKIPKIRFRLGFRHRPGWGSLQRSPRPPSWISGVLLLRTGGGGEGKGQEGCREMREGGGTEDKEGEETKKNVW